MLFSISKLSRSERSLVLSESTYGSNVCFKGKKHSFQLGRLLADKCVSHTKEIQIACNRVKVGLYLCESIEIMVNLDDIKVCVRASHNVSGNLAFFLSKLP